MQKYDICAVLIVKNEEHNIVRAINSVKHFCSQIVVVDTGSTDSTPILATKLGAEVYFHNWENDFSKARNHSLSYARTEWILQIDADEVIEKDFTSEFLKNSDNSKIGGMRVIIKNPLKKEADSPYSEHLYTRIFRNDRRFKYVGKIHEQIADSILESAMEIVDSDIEITHYGYIDTSEQKIKRNKILLVQEIEDNPDDTWMIYHLAEAEFADMDFEEAEKLFRKIVNSVKLTKQQMEMSKIRIAQIALRNDDYESVKDFTDFSSNDIHLEGFRLYVRATGELVKKNFREAVEMFQFDEVRKSGLVDKTQLKMILEKFSGIV